MNAKSDDRGRPLRRDAVIAASVLLVAGGVVGVLAAGPALAEAQAVSAVHDLRAPATAADALPKGFPVELHGEGGLRPETARVLGSDAESTFWVVLDRAGGVCLVGQSLVDPELTAASCGTASTLESSALDVRLSSATWNVNAFLVPDSAAPGKIPASWHVLGENLVTVETDAAAAWEIPRDGAGEPLTLVPSADPATVETR